MREKDTKRGRSVHMYILDNEPMLWNSTHRDVHPSRVTYDELLERTIAYGTAVREGGSGGASSPGRPSGAGPTTSARRRTSPTGAAPRPDRRAHGDVPLLALVPAQAARAREEDRRAHPRRAGRALLPAGRGRRPGKGGKTDPETGALRIRSTRALWDPTYKDESWIDEPVRLIPRMQEVDRGELPRPGHLHRRVQLRRRRAHERRAGAGRGARAASRQAGPHLRLLFDRTRRQEQPRVLGVPRLPQLRRAGRRASWTTTCPPPRTEGTSLFASRDEDGRHLVAVALNLDPDTARDAHGWSSRAAER